MLRQITIQGEQHHIDLSIRTITQLAKLYGTDITGLAEIISNKAGDVDANLDFVERLGVLALNDGAERANNGRVYTVYDIRDYITLDVKFADVLTEMLLDTFERSEVFLMPSKVTATKKSRK